MKIEFEKIEDTKCGSKCYQCYHHCIRHLFAYEVINEMYDDMDNKLNFCKDLLKALESKVSYVEQNCEHDQKELFLIGAKKQIEIVKNEILLLLNS